jgi:hypothetical protein
MLVVLVVIHFGKDVKDGHHCIAEIGYTQYVCEGRWYIVIMMHLDYSSCDIVPNAHCCTC